MVVATKRDRWSPADLHQLSWRWVLSRSLRDGLCAVPRRRWDRAAPGV